ncbi:hypothetical protein [Halobellus marinus]|uniref:hypothetical protein n=1 Tax=Halobellus TaxID=1073986 RepID=UPI0028ACF4F0|nr:hypothetical protein [Halobellus sp. DFY28]
MDSHNLMLFREKTRGDKGTVRKILQINKASASGLDPEAVHALPPEADQVFAEAEAGETVIHNDYSHFLPPSAATGSGAQR